MEVVQVDDATLLTRRDGEPAARPLVLVNALGTDLRVWDRLVRYLADRFLVVRYDMRGQGLSTIGDAPLDPVGLAHDLALLMDQLDTGPAVICGLELGALAALALSQQRPELATALVLVSAGCRIETPAYWHERRRRAAEHGLDDLADDTLDTWLPAAFRAQRAGETTIWRNMFLRAPLAGYIAGCGAMATGDVTAPAREVHVPTLVLSGTASSRPRRAAARHLAATIPNAAAAHVTDAGLLAHVAQPGPVAAAFWTFLEHHGLE